MIKRRPFADWQNWRMAGAILPTFFLAMIGLWNVCTGVSYYFLGETDPALSITLATLSFTVGFLLVVNCMGLVEDGLIARDKRWPNSN